MGSDSDHITLTPLGIKLAKKRFFKDRKIIEAVASALSEAEIREWQKLEHMAQENLTSYDVDRLIFLMQKASLIAVTPAAAEEAHP
jgi:hypothetical protein